MGPFSGVEQAIFTLLGTKLEGRKWETQKGGEEEKAEQNGVYPFFYSGEPAT
jgi:hypothetical protein